MTPLPSLETLFPIGTDERGPNNKSSRQTLNMLIRETYAAGADFWSYMLDTEKGGRPDGYEIPTLVTPEDKLELLYPIRVEIGQQRIPVLTCWKWLRSLKRDSFLYAILSGNAGWEENRRFLDSITEASPVPTLSLLSNRDATADVECIHMLLLFKLLHARALDEDPVVTPAEARVHPDYRSRVTDLTTSISVLQLVRVIALADQYGV